MDDKGRFAVLKELDANDRFFEIMQNHPSIAREYIHLEKICYLESILTEQVSAADVLALSSNKVVVKKLKEFVVQSKVGDEFWLFHDVPGDSGVALLRSGSIEDYLVLDIISL